MKEKEIILNEENKGEEKGEMVISDFGAIQKTAKSSRKYYTTIDLSEQKKLYNLDNADCDFLISSPNKRNWSILEKWLISGLD